MAFIVGAAVNESIGSIKPWLRATISTPLPTGWVICDGTVVNDPASPFNGMTLPDLRGKFIRSHDTLTNANFGADTDYYPGGSGVQTGGSDTHSHAAGSHTHSTPNHDHSLANGTQTGVVGGGGTVLVAAGTDFAVPYTTHTHNNGGNTDTSGGGTSGGASGSVDAADGKPAYRGLLYILKIK